MPVISATIFLKFRQRRSGEPPARSRGPGVLSIAGLPANGIVLVLLHPAVGVLHPDRPAHAVVGVGGGPAVAFGAPACSGEAGRGMLTNKSPKKVPTFVSQSQMPIRYKFLVLIL